MKPIPVFVGYDPREAIAYHVCANSIIRNASAPVAIIPVALNLFTDYKETHGDNSNHFVYTRFLVPYLMDFKGRAIFRAWKEDGGKTQAYVLKAIEASRDKFYAAVGYN